MQNKSDQSDQSDPLGILDLFRSDPPPQVSDQSDRPAPRGPAGPTGPTAASKGRTEITAQNQRGPTGPTGPTDIEGGATIAPPRPEPDPAPPPRADGLDPDAGAYLDRLRLHGPATYGAMASTLGWGATRAWRAEARLRAARLVEMDKLGRAVPKSAAGKP